MSIATSDYHFELPDELIAQVPLLDRTASRLLVLNKDDGSIQHMTFKDLPKFLKRGDCLVLNNSRVLPARLFGQRTSGAIVEFLLLKRLPVDGCVWECLVKPGKKARTGEKFTFGDGQLTAEITGLGEEGARHVTFFFEGIFEEVLDQLGMMPLPPYITEKLDDQERYQTVYSKTPGSAAAPTAGLHFTETLLDELAEKGIETAYVTLHVGLGTFRPVKAETITDHVMHSEYYEITQTAADTINKAKADGHRIITVGTTSTRTLESAVGKSGILEAGSGWTDIFIYPGYEFKVVSGLVTNFHLPESTLIMLVSTLAGRENVLAAYNEAVKEKYRFFSFGDAMLVL